MRTYTAIEAARLLDVSEKTIRRWIEEKKLEANKQPNNRLAIPETEIARLQLEREQTQESDQDQAALASRLADLERKYTGLVERVARLEARVQTDQERA